MNALVRTQAAVLSLLVALVASASITATCRADDEKLGGELNFYNFAEYMDPKILADFQKHTGVKVNESYYESTEDMVAKLQHGGGVSQYDLVVVTDRAVPQMARLGLITKLDHAALKNLGNLDERFQKLDVDPGNQYSVAYQWGTVGILYNKKKLPDLEPSWGAIFDPAKQKGRFLLLDEMRDMVGVALRYKGFDVNTVKPEELKAASEVIIEAKRSKKALGFEGGVGAKNKIAGGSADLGIVWNGDAFRAIEDDPKKRLDYVIPREGSMIWTDTIAITGKAPNPRAAHAFIDFLLDPKVGARLSNFNKFATPNKASLPFIDPADAKNPILYPSPETLATMQSLRDVGEADRLYDEVWTAVKSR
jgi:spermidine/putrescine transport system substrate-binding protein